MNNQNDKNSINRVLEALEDPSAFTPEELKTLFADQEYLETARAILYGREALARKQASAPDVDKEWNRFVSRKKKSRQIHYIISLSTVACILLLFFFRLLPAHKEDAVQVFEACPTTQSIHECIVNGQTIITVPRGMQKQFKLPDGTQVFLNADSRLSYDANLFGRKERHVNLTGEGFFEVAQDSLHPFKVQAGKIETYVLGTSFNIRNYNTESTSVTLFSGSLQIASAKKNNRTQIRPGEQAVLTPDNGLSICQLPHISEAKSWTNHSFCFDNKTLKEILCELGRWYNVNVIFKDESRMNDRLHFKASREESLDAIIELLGFISKDISVADHHTIIVGK